MGQEWMCDRGNGGPRTDTTFLTKKGRICSMKTRAVHATLSMGVMGGRYGYGMHSSEDTAGNGENDLLASN